MDEHRITSPEQLRQHYAEPMQRAIDKVITHFAAPHRHLVESSPFLVIGTQSSRGADVSPRGDRPGFVAVLDDTTLAIPDRVGNRRLDTLTNILENPQVALIFFVPGLNETLRVNGRAHLSADPQLLRRLAHEGKPAIMAIVVKAEEIFHQCVRATRRAGLWDPSLFVGPEFPRISSTPESEYDGRLYEEASKN